MPDQPTSPLDAGAYPHIIENILANVPTADLVRLRAVSRTVRDHIDATLLTCYEVVLVDHGSHCPHNCTTPCGVGRVLRDGGTDATPLCVQDLPTPGTLVKVVDFYGECASDLGAVLDHIGTAHTLQRIGASTLLGAFPAQLHPRITTVVDYLELASVPVLAVPIPHPVTGVDEYYHQVPVPPSVRRYILHLTFNQVCCELDSFGLQTEVRFTVSPGTLQDFVLVLWPLFYGTPVGGPLSVAVFPSFPPPIAQLFAAAAEALAGGAAMTIVGADRLSPLLFGRVRGCTSPRYVVKEIRERIRVLLAAKFRGTRRGSRTPSGASDSSLSRRGGMRLGPFTSSTSGGRRAPKGTRTKTTSCP